jgi:hypothetical protein
MAKKFRDFAPVRGGAALWSDGGPGSVLLVAEFFDDPLPPSGGGLIKVWTGSAWVEKPVKFWSGSAWVEKPVKFWSGSAWVLS